MSGGLEGFLWGILSAVSLPLGALIGLWWQPKQKINSAFMAFGAGALLFALTIELFGHVPHHVTHHGKLALGVTVLSALAGGLIFDCLNQALNQRGAFLRRFSNAKQFVARLKSKRAYRLLKELSQIEVLKKMPPEKMAALLTRLHREDYAANETLFKQGNPPLALFFIVGGEVSIVRHDQTGQEKAIATLKSGDVFGELGLLTGEKRTADAITLSPVRVYKITKRDWDGFLPTCPELQEAVQKLALSRVDDLSHKSEDFEDEKWRTETFATFERCTQTVTEQEIIDEGQALIEGKAGGASLSIFLGISIDGIPESLVIGMLANNPAGMSLAFIAGVFLANMPEAMSSAVSMQRGGFSSRKILLMWSIVCFLTGVGAMMGASLFPAQPEGNLFYWVLGIEGLAAGAMLTMIAESMLPEAFEQGGHIVGISTLLGFLAALIVKVI